ncbi:hypothetical protein BFW38_12260 [Terasakiispira papahanaumokuakeensis]|uniref:Secondary thiamine-phosphate synthase n=1 Tax=Terasakiispira papahanaumokuakeensis TaxID=197479 RepID=A0A1E2VBH5_9GAMM|nr:secondary thiamine-phosphate synthase enzyme YjbQ [Terasakiispira papahanaumokuakeensis]ODC04186.1 hypothetical protein BFW38_12260 [Terasakiispira papahanaumokuakeensis]
MIKTLTISTHGQGLYEFTRVLAPLIKQSHRSEGLCSLLVQHTSASLLIQENADPSARDDLEQWLNRLVPEQDSAYTHTHEGPDDMPAHIKAALTATTLSIPFQHNRLLLGTWQGLYLWEHRHQPASRRIVVHLST